MGYSHTPHPHLAHRKETGPVTTDHHRFHGKTTLGRVNALIGLKITLLVGTMACGYLFAAIALISLPSAVKTHNLTILVAWISSAFLQLILLPVIIVGQNVQAKAADGRAESTWKDAETILHECLELQKHLAAQDAVLAGQEDKLAALILSMPPSPPRPPVRVWPRPQPEPDL